MKYSREKINSFLIRPINKIEHDIVAQDLVNSVLNGKEVSLAEESFACSIIKLLRTHDTNELAYDITKINSCKNYRFKNIYLLYFSDLNGHKIVKDAYGEISIVKKKIDVEYLEKEYDNWKQFIKIKLSENSLIGFVARETQYQIKQLYKYGIKKMLGSRYLKYLEKSLTLHGKYIYLTVKESFQEHGSEEIIFEFNNNKFLIDSYSYVHILFRHYSQSIKEHQFDKSYHFDKNIEFNDIPRFILDLLKKYSLFGDLLSFNKQNIYFQFKGNFYAIWFRKITQNIKGGSTVEYFRVQTLYPVENKQELQKILKFNFKTANEDFVFLY